MGDLRGNQRGLQYKNVDAEKTRLWSPAYRHFVHSKISKTE